MLVSFNPKFDSILKFTVCWISPCSMKWFASSLDHFSLSLSFPLFFFHSLIASLFDLKRKGRYMISFSCLSFVSSRLWLLTNFRCRLSVFVIGIIHWLKHWFYSSLLRLIGLDFKCQNFKSYFFPPSPSSFKDQIGFWEVNYEPWFELFRLELSCNWRRLRMRLSFKVFEFYFLSRSRCLR